MDKKIREELILGHLEILEHDLGRLKGGIQSSLPFGPHGVIIHGEHAVEVIDHAARSTWAIRDLIEHQDDTEEGKDTK